MDLVLDRFFNPALSLALKIYINIYESVSYSFSSFTNFKKTALVLGFTRFNMKLTEKQFNKLTLLLF